MTIPTLDNSGLSSAINQSGPETAKDVAEQHWWVALIEFAVHVITGTLIFVVIAAPAVGLDLLLQWLSTIGVGSFILWGLSFAEKAIFGIDLFLFLYYLINASWRFVQGLQWRAR